MEPFRCPDPADRQWALPLLAAQGEMGCEYNFDNIYLWSRAYPQKLARLGDRLLVQIQGKLGVCYLYPAGSGPLGPALDALGQDAAAHGAPLTLVCVTAAQRQALEGQFPGRFSWQEDRDGWDYLYDVNRLADLPGKKLHAKRNHIHRLDEAYPGWTWSWLTRADVEPCRQMDRLWLQQARQREEVQGLSTLDGENRALDLALTHWQEVGLEGVVLRWQDQILGFSLGAPLTETIFDVHFERARADIQGAYPAVNRSFAQAVRQKYPHIRYLDREDDMGLPGLRKAKLSYRPDYLQVNFSAVECCADK